MEKNYGSKYYPSIGGTGFAPYRSNKVELEDWVGSGVERFRFLFFFLLRSGGVEPMATGSLPTIAGAHGRGRRTEMNWEVLRMRLTPALLAFFTLPTFAFAQEPISPRNVSTFSIVACDPATGQMG